jgi:predicted ATPase
MLRASFEGAVCFFDLAPLSDPLIVPSAVASILGLYVQTNDPIQATQGFLRNKRMLIILDGCEHVIETAAMLAEQICEEAAQVHILATSREPLLVEGEHVYQLPPLESPPGGAGIAAAQLLSFSAAQLFVERVAASGDRFELNDNEARIVGEICRRLDGIAFAIELAAGRVKAYGIRQTAELINSRFVLLQGGRRTAPPRHQTLSATLDWSYDLLQESERVVLRRLSIFVGIFTVRRDLE